MRRRRPWGPRCPAIPSGPRKPWFRRWRQPPARDALPPPGAIPGVRQPNKSVLKHAWPAAASTAWTFADAPSTEAASSSLKILRAPAPRKK